MLELPLWWNLGPGSLRYSAAEVDVPAPYGGRFKVLWGRCVVCLLLLTCLAGDAALAEERVAEGQPVVLQIRLKNEAVTPVTARFIERAIRQAEQERVACLVILLDTPGGLFDSTRRVAKSILSSDVPVVETAHPHAHEETSRTPQSPSDAKGAK